MFKISVIIPAYNEEKTILTLLEKVNQQKIDMFSLEIIVIDDGSKDKTVKILKENSNLYSKLIEMPKNGGKGAAVQAGLKVATGDYILFQDADLEYDPSDYQTLFLPVKLFNADVVMGSRFMAPRYTRVTYFWHKVGNLIITFLFNILNNTTFTDIYSGYLMYKRKLLIPEDLKTFKWEQQAEILSKVIRNGEVFYEVPISYHGRSYAEGKKIRAIHVVSVIKTIIIEKFFATKV